MMQDAISYAGKVMLVGADPKRILERRLQSAGCQVVSAEDERTAMDVARHERFDMAVLIPAGPVIGVAETIFNLRDLNRSMEIIVLVESRARNGSRFLRRLLDYPIAGARILTRRQLRKQLFTIKPSSPGESR